MKSGRMSAKSLFGKAVVLAAGGAAIWLSVSAGIAGAARVGNPALALRWAPYDARAAERRAEQLAKPDASAEDLNKAANYAAAAIERDPTLVRALRTMALVSELRGNRQNSARLLNYSAQLSRRDLQTRLWLIEQRVAANDIPGALLQYDIALRTTRSNDLLFPILIAATSEASVTRALADRLTTSPAWRDPFLDRLVAEGPSLANLLLLDTELRRAGEPPTQEQTTALLQRLIEADQFAMAWRVYKAAKGLAMDADAAALRNGDFSAEPTFPPLDWALTSGGGVSAWLAPADGGSDDPALLFEAEAGQGGLAARQLLLLRPGRYTVSAQVGNIADDPASLPQMLVQCAGESQRLLLADLLASGDGGTSISHAFSVPADCSAQWFSIELRAPETRPDEPAWIDDIRVSPQGN